MFEQIKISLPLKGRTYSLYADELRTDLYYEKIKNIADKFLKFFKNEKEFLSLVQSLSVKKRALKKIGKAEGFLFELINTLKGELSGYTKEVKNHLENLSLFERRDRVLSTSEEQYHLYML
ncbi:MAG TPA: hypothetical protein VLM39_06555 [Ignavibacteriaceae bacterium]|nr:hypothetical protein [Ignavibacteriaceae bacterium]